ncbi:DNA mismatch repair endonuclease MutL [Celerinatantimonas yamalensis]|uniref:DNA mismatch repair protein MutL n=1 Tax=Celerinatantimonas yamalensis TaxID=559956 RepID=A0ABW9G602_9GAMM
MTIQILPAQLANQIAAGEVVERPASVVKELVENSLDAGASEIEIVIDRGGHKRILVRDNGCGVAEAEITLALSRHATSKLSSQDDLAHIDTLGFRGEALASISSVARLTMTSRPMDQENAWQAQASGRDMTVVVTPAAHPIGTSVEVQDLFFNTPARRKFLRSEKTEFNHIDEQLKRLALSYYPVSIKLTHNGKLLRHYRAAKTPEQFERRVSSVLGKGFTEQSWALDNQHQSLHFWGWLGRPEVARSNSDHQYFYVNGRAIRDKLILHAIRQSFAAILDEHVYPSFVLYLELPCDQVDVNVHPTKHEVRFHQARLIHDYIQKIISEVLHSQLDGADLQPISEHYHDYGSIEAPSSSVEQSREVPRAEYQPQALRYTSEKPAASQVQVQRQWLDSASESLPAKTELVTAARMRPLQLIESRYLLVGDQTTQLALLNLGQGWQRYYSQQFLQQWDSGITRAPLLLPQKIALEAASLRWLKEHLSELTQLGFGLRDEGKAITVLGTPSCLRRAPLQPLIETLCSRLMAEDEALQTPLHYCQHLAQIGASLLQFNWSQALAIYQQLLDEQTAQLPAELMQTITGCQLLETLK